MKICAIIRNLVLRYSVIKHRSCLIKFYKAKVEYEDRIGCFRIKKEHSIKERRRCFDPHGRHTEHSLPDGRAPTSKELQDYWDCLKKNSEAGKRY